MARKTFLLKKMHDYYYYYFILYARMSQLMKRNDDEREDKFLLPLPWQVSWPSFLSFPLVSSALHLQHL
jgi:hypothetical protein